MSLRFQITIRVLLFSLCIIIIGGTVAIWQARNAVNEEVESSINMALQLVKLGFSARPNLNINESEWAYGLNALKQTRHLSIQLIDPSGQLIHISENTALDAREDAPPRWFSGLVSVNHAKVEHKIQTAGDDTLTLIIQANPLDEITEVWGETIAFFLTICLLVLLTFLAVHLVFNKSLRAINAIVKELKSIETGDYKNKLPSFSIQEYDQIARAINHMADVLEQTRQQNQSLTQHSLQIQEEERQHLSQELHDELGQSLTAIKVLAATAAHSKSDTPKIMTSITEICDHLISVVRLMMRNLHPLILTELGLKATLEDMVNHWQDRNSSLSIKLFCEDDIDRLNHKVIIQLFRVIQECLTNINRHAQATEVQIELGIDERNNIFLKVIDNGLGCNIDKVKSGFGLLGMQERIKSLDGVFSVYSRLGEGVKVEAIIPIA
ncbi:MAG: two-component system, NarL family, sensor histidine kinase UhpB [Methyloprofundus sp.]|nr:MAG: two-component system, NarL family, sensor histidine kinase UhpB [Methyloprofundus sp.]